MNDSESEDSTVSLSRTVCTLCRQRKTKCDRKLPRCTFCDKAKVDCHYVPQPKKRGLRAGYVSGLESRIAKLESQVNTLQNQSGFTSVTKASSSRPFEHQPNQMSPGITPAIAYQASRTSHTIHLPGIDAVTTDMMKLPVSFYCALAESWFKEEQAWVPILEHEHIQNSLKILPDPVDHIEDVVLRAVIALKIAYSSYAISLGYEGRRRLSLHLRSQALSEAMSEPSMSSIQALIIIALLDYGSDDIPSTFNIMSMCRRTCEHIGIFRQLLQRIELESPAQIGPPAEDVFSNDNATIARAWAVLSFDTVSSLGVSWRDASEALIDHLSGVAYLSTPDFRDSFRTHIHLTAIGLQPVHDFFFAYAKGEHQVLEGGTLTITEDLYRNLMSYVYGLPSSGYTILADGAVDFDINHIFTRLLSHQAIIMIYQRYITDGEGNVSLARDRCMESYRQTIDIVRNISDADAEINTPTFAHFIAIAARFKLVDSMHNFEIRDRPFDILMHGINMCGRRWPVARRIEICLRIAIAEIESRMSSSTVESRLPEIFWNLKESSLDISETLKKWLHSYKPSLYIGSLNGPYA